MQRSLVWAWAGVWVAGSFVRCSCLYRIIDTLAIAGQSGVKLFKLPFLTHRNESLFAQCNFSPHIANLGAIMLSWWHM